MCTYVRSVCGKMVYMCVCVQCAIPLLLIHLLSSISKQLNIDTVIDFSFVTEYGP